MNLNQIGTNLELISKTSIMKYLIILIAFSSFSLNAQDCNIQASNEQFQIAYSVMAGQSNDQNKLNNGITSFSQHCFTANQIKLMAMLFQDEQIRLDFCKMAYPRTFDRDNFYDVYDAFQTFSHALKLYNYVQNYSETAPLEQIPTNIVLTYPNYIYPDYNGYHGLSGCTEPVNNQFFDELAQTLSTYQSDDELLHATDVLLKDVCLSITQAMKLGSFFKSEILRMTFFKNTFPALFDQENYGSVQQCFSGESLKKEWTAYCLVILYPKPLCTVTEEGLKNMIKRIDDANFADDQLAIVRLLNKDWCFSTAQVKRIMEEFSFPENKLDAAEILYEKCTDKQNYSQLAGSFSFPSYEEDFRKLISRN